MNRGNLLPLLLHCRLHRHIDVCLRSVRPHLLVRTLLLHFGLATRLRWGKVQR